jgi:hypothetical protein
MKESTGVIITIVAVILILGLLVVKEIFRFQKKYDVLADIFSWIIIFIPAIYMTILGNDFTWNDAYLTRLDPSGDAAAALTYSPFHFFSIFMMIAGAFYLAYRANTIDRFDDKRYFGGLFPRSDYTIFKVGVLLLTIEIYKQIIFLTALTGYQWYGFPYQFCSSPIYILLVLPFVKEGKVKDALYHFLGIFGLIAGLSVMLVGGGVFTKIVAIDVHTMIWHSMMVIVGVYAVVYKKMGLKFKEYLGGITVLLVLILIAQVLNIIFHYADPGSTGPAKADLFFINPYHIAADMPVLTDWRRALYDNLPGYFLPGFLYTLIYFLVFSAGAGIIYAIESLIKYLVNRHQKRAEAK